MNVMLSQFAITPQACSFLLLMLVLAPLFGLAIIAINRSARGNDSRNAALGVSLGVLILAAAATAIHLFRPEAIAGPPAWADDLFVLLRSSLALGADGLSVWLVLMTAVLMPLAILASSHSIRAQAKGYYGLLMLLESAMLGAFLARDLLWFYIFFEFTLVPLFFIIGIWGGPQRRRAAHKFFVFTLAGSLLMLAVVLYLGMRAGMNFDFAAIAKAAGAMPRHMQVLLFLGLFAGFAVKVPLFPLHTWLPLAHTEAPTAGSVILAGVLLKLGTYGFLRIGMGFLPAAALTLAPMMGALAVAGIVYGSLAAWAQADVKKLVAYSSIAHLGFCMLGMFALRPAGLTGSVLVMINHGISTGALFIVVGMIYERYHTRQFAELGGLARRMPVISFFLVFFALSSLGLPGLNGFVGEFLVLAGAFASARPGAGLPPVLGWPFVVLAAGGVILSAVYLLHMVGRLVFGPRVEQAAEEHPLPADANGREWTILLPLAALVLLLGLWPQPVIRSIERSAGPLLASVAAAASPPAPVRPTRPLEPEFWPDEEVPLPSPSTQPEGPGRGDAGTQGRGEQRAREDDKELQIANCKLQIEDCRSEPVRAFSALAALKPRIPNPKSAIRNGAFRAP